MGKTRTLVVPYPKGIVGGLLESLSPEQQLLKGGGLEYQTWAASYDCTNAVEDLEGSGVECPDFKDYAGNLVGFVRESPNVGEDAMN